MPEPLTVEQAAFAGFPDGAFVHACPGSGKTRTIVARLAVAASTIAERKGIAVLSFTNSAVDEFRERCAKEGLGQFLAHPSLIGTVDAFLRRFVVMPSLAAGARTKPIIVESWETLGVGIRLAGRFAFRGAAAPLDAFDPRTNTVNPIAISDVRLRAHVLENRERYERAAARRRESLGRAGYLSAADARVVASATLAHPEIGGALGRAIAARFHEVVVDEGQDCNPHDLQLLEWLRRAGVRISLVCDPEQAIYEFRDGTPDRLRRFGETFEEASRLTLTGNFRCSPVICRLAATLRSENRVDTSIGDSAGIDLPILLLAYPGQAAPAGVGSAFAAKASDLGLDVARAIVLAHSGRVAHRAAGSVLANDGEGSSRVAALARSVAEYWGASSGPRMREKALQRVECILLDLLELREEDEPLSRAIERAGVDTRWLRRSALKLVACLPAACGRAAGDRAAWVESARTGLEQLGLALPNGVSARGFLREPTNGRWAGYLDPPEGATLRSAKIHEAKGREYESVCVVLPPNRAPENRTEALLQAWENRTDSEAKRVIYVGVTRAQKFVALAAPQGLAARVVRLFEDGRVRHLRQDL